MHPSETFALAHQLPEPPIPQTLEDVIVMQRAMAIRIDAIERASEAMAFAQEGFTELLQANTDATARTERNTGELVELFTTFRTGFKALNTVAKFIAPFTAIAGALAAMWSAWAKWKGAA